MSFYRPVVGKTYQKIGDQRVVIKVVHGGLIYRRPRGAKATYISLSGWVKWLQTGLVPKRPKPKVKTAPPVVRDTNYLGLGDDPEDCPF